MEIVATILAITVLAALVGIFKPYLPNWQRKHFAFTALGAFIAFAIVAPPPPGQRTLPRSDRPTPQSAVGNPDAKEKSQPVSPEQQYREQLQREIASLRRNPRMGDVPETQAGVMTGIVLIGARVELLRRAPPNLSAETKRIEAEYRRLQQAFQSDLFPRLRRIQGRVWNSAMWEHDIEVAVAGSRAERVTFTGGLFVLNRNIAEAHDAAGETIRGLRFRKDRYQWYSGSRSYEYDNEPPADDVLATLSDSGSWIPLR